MSNHRMSFIITLAATALLQACNQGPDPAKVQGDVTKAQADGQKMIVDAQAKLDQVNAQANKEVVNAQVDANAAAAKDPAATPPPENAVADTRKDANLDVADAQYNLEKVKAEAAYNVAKAQCEAQTGDSGKTCNDNAKSRYDGAVNDAKAKNDAIHARAKG
jgi:hypothetical protein